MAQIIAEINDKVPDARGHKILFNDDSKIYLYNGSSYREIDADALLRLDDRGCLNWRSEEMHTKIVEYVEGIVWQKQREQTVIIPKEGNIYNSAEGENTTKRRKKIISIVLIVLNLLALGGVVLSFLLRPKTTQLNIPNIDLHSQLVRKNVGKSIVAVNPENGEFLISNNSTSVDGNAYIENALLGRDDNGLPLFLGPIKPGLNFKQTTPAVAEDQYMISADNRNNPGVFSLYYMDLQNYREVPFADNGHIGDEKASSSWSVENYGVNGRSIFFVSTDGSGIRYLFFSNSESVKSGQVIAQKIDSSPTAALGSIHATTKWLVYKKDSSVMVGRYQTDPTGQIFSYTDKPSPIALSNKLTAQYKNYDFQIEDVKDTAVGTLLLLRAESRLYVINLDDAIKSVPGNAGPSQTAPGVPSQTATATPSATSATAVSPVDVSKGENVDPTNAILFRDYSGENFVVYSMENGLIAWNFKSGENVPLDIPKSENVIGEILGYRSRIYWSIEEKVPNEASRYNLYETLIVPPVK